MSEMSGLHRQIDSESRSKLDFWLWVSIAVLVSLLCGVSVLLYRAVADHARELAKGRFVHAANARIAAVSDELVIAMSVIRTLGDFLEASESVSWDSFTLVAGNATRRYPWISALEWAPRLPSEQRAAFVTQMQRHFTDFSIKQVAADDVDSPAGRPDVYPVSYIVPLAGNEQAHGLDLGSDALRRSALEAALASRDIAVTRPIQLVQAAEKKSAGVLMFLPLATPAWPVSEVKMGKTGVLVGVFRLDLLIASALDHFQDQTVRTELEDESAPEGSLKSGLQTVFTSTGNSYFQLHQMIRFGDRDWKINAYADESAFPVDEPWAATAVLTAALAFSGMIGAFLSYLMLSSSRIRLLAKQFAYSATHDLLTGAGNRSLLIQRADVELKGAAKADQPMALLLLDIDHFKAINDGFGHHAGDEALRVFAATLTRHLRQTDFLARIGGEEFTILAPAAGPEKALALAERLRAAVASEEVDVGGNRFNMTVSIGLAHCRGGNETLDSLLKAADAALYRAKGEGRNRVVVAASVAEDQV